MDKLSIVGILVDERTKSASKVQEVLTKYGDSIISRFGTHDPGEKEHGLITLNFRGENERLTSLMHDLEKLDVVKVKSINMK
ncbi:hypothetical protein BJV85_002669 [Clostridium acetobutylicum]|uniref:Uncharacterized protein homolog T.maritima (4980675) n=1 Tax=Clostridium acetobutylicum (strain ATCC 824 / DSM 792 / JCM 1419 / IAM 19013 / LMG 5710 / NBRC 13948 / NRRL B-527 / VKM B-1787 / 2291 / W) TaxID=272562 RepID=Q97JF9_CLOAB|nr:hypothetical protein [Clostridium acetobutylicum]PSM04739.1 hypothetical protein C7T89_15405 [Clostridium sp. NJ4]AAK79295.1 Uncharacterized protein homolog T.maritima (4980675) [Clostridium acetobutylicum ATCC 824]ADZ20377.1 Conserved hypothetical protein [Clostridium acetobutylicum EA 2018]AEI31767.1 hypothetical protein SMB_G1349 [Clostridium acetobutylicum DSM 1731]AWV81455.1 hypothetical protein DK921_15410 [Clostridium acetobutylicum]